MQRLTKQATTKRYRQYKAGKRWITAAVVAGAGFVFTVTLQTGGHALADSQAPEQAQVASSGQTDPSPTQATSATTDVSEAQKSAAQGSETTAASAQPVTAAVGGQQSVAQPQVATETKATATVATEEKTQAQSTSAQAATPTRSQAQTADAPVTTPAPANADSLAKGNVAGLWSEGYRGQGMVVAVIDSGVNPNPNLRLSVQTPVTVTQAKVESFIAKHGYGQYVSDKIPFAYDYANNDSINTEPDEKSSPHGEHVSGIIAANGQASVDAKGQAVPYVIGVAPEAQILNMQVFGRAADETPNNIARAIYDAVDLGANVINFSLGIGVGKADLTDEEQAAIAYAIDHGVFVAIAASNNGNGASIGGTVAPGGIDVGYPAVNDTTIANPGVAGDVITVAAENSASGADSDMADFTSWGPTTDYKLKPDVAAPGVNILSTVGQGLKTMSGTSMATPYVAGSALLLLQKFHATRPDLSGAALVNAVKLALMNAAAPMADINYAGELISPRRQGAGQIDVTKAGDLNVSAVGTDATGSVSLQEIGAQTQFTVTLTNHGTTAQHYSVDLSRSPLTQVIDADNGNIVHDIKLAGASLTTDSPTFDLAAGASKQVTFTLALANTVRSNQLVEGFIGFVAADGTQSLSVPYLGFYGKTSSEEIFDQSANQAGSIFKGGYLVDNQNNPLGITDPKSLSDYVNSGRNDIAWTDIGAKVVSGKVAFSPNADSTSNTVMPYVFTKQNLKTVTAEILAASGQVVRVVDIEQDTTKSFYQDGSGYNSDLALSVSMRLHPEKLTWDGKIYDQASGELVVAPDGQYTYRLIGETYFDDAQQQFDLPVIIDTQVPVLSDASVNGGVVSVHYQDVGVGFAPETKVDLLVGGKHYGVALGNDGHNNSGVWTYTLTAAQQQAFSASGQIKISLSDVAGNVTTATIGTATEATDNETQPQASPQFVWVVPNGTRNYYRPEDGFTQVVTKDTHYTVQAKVPIGTTGAIVTDQISGKGYFGQIDLATGVASFDIDAADQNYAYLVGHAFNETDFGTFAVSPDVKMVIFYSATGAAYSNVGGKSDAFVSEETAKAATTTTAGAPLLPGRALKDITTRAEPNAGIHFTDLGDNNFTLVGIDKADGLYDATNHRFTIRGKVDDPSHTKLQILATSYPDDPENQVTFDAQGNFSIQVPFDPTEEKDLGYRLTTVVDGATVSAYGFLQIYLDTTLPTLSLPDASSLTVDDQGHYVVTTSAETFTIAGAVSDNVSGYRLYVNGSDLVTQKNRAGFNVHQSSLLSQPLTNGNNPYGAVDFSQQFTLKPGINYITLQAVDQVGNVVTKIFKVIRETTATEPTTPPVATTTPEQTGAATQRPVVTPLPAIVTTAPAGAATQTATKQSPLVPAGQRRTATGAQLPATGDAQSPVIAWIGAAVAGFLSLLGISRVRREETK